MSNQLSRRSSLSTHPQPEQVADSIDLLRRTLRDHLANRNFLFDEHEVNRMARAVTTIRQHHHSSQKDNQEALAELRSQLQINLSLQEEEVGALRGRWQQEMQARESQFNQRVLAVNNDHGRKQQSYKEVIEKLMGALTAAQKKHQALHLRMSSQMQTVAKTLQSLLASQKHDRRISSKISSIIEEIILRQENSMISSKSEEALSLDDIDINDVPSVLDAANSSNAPDLAGEISSECLQKQIQGWLEKLICFGFFEPSNQQLIKKMLSFTKNCEEPTELLEDKIFLAIIDLLVCNMRAHQEKGRLYMRGVEGGNPCEEGSCIQLRNINNLSELDLHSGCEVSVAESDREQSRRLSSY